MQVAAAISNRGDAEDCSLRIAAVKQSCRMEATFGAFQFHYTICRDFSACGVLNAGAHYIYALWCAHVLAVFSVPIIEERRRWQAWAHNLRASAGDPPPHNGFPVLNDRRSRPPPWGGFFMAAATPSASPPAAFRRPEDRAMAKRSTRAAASAADSHREESAVPPLFAKPATRWDPLRSRDVERRRDQSRRPAGREP